MEPLKNLRCVLSREMNRLDCFGFRISCLGLLRIPIKLSSMRCFARLYEQLDASNRTRDKVAALTAYFQEAPPEDAVWALWLLMGRRFRRLVSTRRLREWAADVTRHPDWMVEACYERVGDLAETITLLLPLAEEGTELPLHKVVTEYVQGLADWDEPVQFQLLREYWQQLDRSQAFLFHKILTGGFRVGVSRNLVIRALADISGLEKAVIAHRLMGNWQPTERFFRELTHPENAAADLSRPYPFYLASPLVQPEEVMGERWDDWFLEWKWDGIRAQLIKRQGQLFLWSRGEELLTERFPEILRAAARLPNGTVLDGEILCWRGDQPEGFHALQRRITRRRLSDQLLEEFPAILLAYDLLESDGKDIRSLPLHQRRALLESLIRQLPAEGALRLSPSVEARDSQTLQALWQSSRQRGVEGLMLKHRDSRYQSGRVRGDWWKWKVAPMTADLVMISAQAGHGRRGGLYTDYTLAARDGDQLVPVAKAYSGLTDAEIREIDRWVKANTQARFGPVRSVPACLVFEIAFEGIRPSSRHKSGLALRFPRIHRWRRDKSPDQIDTVDTLRALV